VDGGDYTHPTLGHEERENWLVLRGMGAMGYDVMTLGEIELSRGVEYVQSIVDSSQVPIALCNVQIAKTKQPIGERFVTRTVGDVTYGIIGLLGQDFGEGKDKLTELGFVIDDPFEAAAKVVPEVRKKVDVVVVLAHIGSADALQLPKAVPGIDVVVFGHYPGIVAPTQIHGAVTVRPGQRGQYIGEMKIVLNPENKIVSYSGEAVPLEVKKIKENAALAAQRDALKKVLEKEAKALGAKAPKDPDAIHSLE
jgi:2',3'-cyclic-nucleotide 2'-phosphodiesterase (5'-nucleotidase family)